MHHYPVMLNEVINNFNLSNKENIVDCTFGAGGYSKAILKNSQANVIAIDKDPEAIERAKFLIKEYPSRFQIFQSSFANIKKVIKQTNLKNVDGIVLDLGVSSFQIDNGERGFSFMHDGPLDMRMGKTGSTAKDIIESYSEESLANIFKIYGEERHSKLIAKKIKEEIFKGNTFKSTLDLANFIKRLIKGKQKIHPATRVFQALRIEVNQELEDLKKVLDDSIDLLNPNGRLIVVSFHSLEDKIVKEKFKSLIGKRKHFNKYKDDSHLEKKDESPEFINITKKVLLPNEEELAKNIRSRSAKMRIIERVK